MVKGIEDLRNLAVDGIFESLRIGQQTTRSQLFETIAHAVLAVIIPNDGPTAIIVPNEARFSHDADVELLG